MEIDIRTTKLTLLTTIPTQNNWGDERGCTIEHQGSENWLELYEGDFKYMLMSCLKQKVNVWHLSKSINRRAKMMSDGKMPTVK